MRPASLIPFTKMAVRVKENKETTFIEIINEIPEPIRWIQHRLWRKIIWDNDKKGMVIGHSKLIELLLIYVYDKSLLKEHEIKKIRKELTSIWDYHDSDIMERLNDIISGDIY